MNMKLSTLALLSTALLAGGCASSRQPAIDYQSTMGKENLEIPPDLTSPVGKTQYALPAGSGAVRATDLSRAQSAAQSGDQSVLPQARGMRIERSGKERWLAIQSMPPQQVWQRLQLFWQKMGFTIARTDPAIGYMETDWAENRAKLPNDGLRRLFDKVGFGNVYSTDERDKFIARIERNPSGGTDVFISHRGMQEVYTTSSKDTTVWQPRASNPDLEALLLGKFMEDLGATRAEADAQVGAVRSPTQELAKIEGENLVVLGADHERNWNRIGMALDRIGLSIVGADASNRRFLVQPLAQESDSVATSKPGFFGRLMGKKAHKAPTVHAKMVVQVDAGSGADKIMLLDQNGAPYRAADAQQWLQRLYTELR